MAKDALAAHTRDELGISEVASANPLQAAFTSALSFTVGAALPLLTAVVAPGRHLSWIVSATSLVFLAVLGGLAAYTGGASITRGVVRVTFWGALAMAITAGVGMVFGAS
ncbi:VIT family protein [mine drainage metagenome]|uniref:VIT family protein n=1 Tax=mine drainage metagenome TaxID=410659 RepID=A0A1J5P0J4_9ZZZZ